MPLLAKSMVTLPSKAVLSELVFIGALKSASSQCDIVSAPTSLTHPNFPSPKQPMPFELLILIMMNPKSWMIEDWPLGDLQRTTGWKPEPRDVELACDGREGREGYSDYWGKEVCSKSSVYMPRMYGFQLIDLNNDGFLDAVLASGIGYQRFFLNNPEASKGNRFIRVELKSTVSNVHSIGTTLIFEASGLEPQYERSLVLDMGIPEVAALTTALCLD
eukprot:scaffold1046_cov136-Skeletonema_dohrnii-CCMP3373.AAC.4